MHNQHSFVLTAGPIEDRSRVAAGELLPCNDTLSEFKIHFNGRQNYESPSVAFTTPSGIVPLELSRTQTGFAGKAYSRGLEVGCNFNRVRRSNTRWGLTVWIKYKTTQTQGAA